MAGEAQAAKAATGSPIMCETRRRLAPVAVAENQLKTLDIPRDTVIKRMNIFLEGQVVTTYASGSPLASTIGSMERICPRIDVVIDGQRTVKSISPYMQQQLNHLYSGDRPLRAYNTGTALTTDLPSTEAASGAAFVYPSTTDVLVLNEALGIHFEMPWAYALGREATSLNVKQVSSAEIRFSFAALSQLQADGSSASVTYSGNTLQMIATLVEAREIPADQNFFDFKETVQRVTYSAEVRDSQIDLPRGNALAGLAILCRNGGSTRPLFDKGIRDLQLLVNGQQVLQRTTFRELQVDNKERYGADDRIASSIHSLQGFAFMNLLKNGDIRSALNTTVAGGVDRVTLQLSTAPSSGGNDTATYTTNPMEVSILSMEIASTPVKA